MRMGMEKIWGSFYVAGVGNFETLYIRSSVEEYQINGWRSPLTDQFIFAFSHRFVTSQLELGKDIEYTICVF
ncbi:unnamed protein product [Citrullus colocynthis]|uniref:Uncharacterized protein n=1 Tax=Citrullus colocynthis TaxID=252529 RepID=A0ABP0YQM9_9ROSI